MLKLYYSPGSCALASHIALEEANTPYEAIPVDFSINQQQSAEYLRINPKGRVPALITDQGILTETPAILAFIAQRCPKAGLAPTDDVFQFARMQSFNSYLCSTVHVNHAHRLRGTRWVDDPEAIKAMQRKVPQTMTQSFSLIEKEMFEGPWVMGAQYSVCDPYLFTISGWLAGDDVPLDQFPVIQDHFERMKMRPAVEKVLQGHQ